MRALRASCEAGPTANPRRSSTDRTMAKVECTVPETLDGARLDKAIVTLVEGASRARAKRAIDEGQVRVNGRALAKGGVVAKGDVITLDEGIVKSGEAPCLPDPDAPLDVRFSTDEVLIVEKPAG